MQASGLELICVVGFLVAGFMKRAWESQVPGWEQMGDPDAAPSGDQNPKAARMEAGMEFTKMLGELYLLGQLSATSICTLCWWAQKAGIPEAERFALKPESPSGHYARKLDSALGLKRHDPTLYYMEMPGYDKYADGRVVHTITTTPLTSLCPKRCWNRQQY